MFYEKLPINIDIDNLQRDLVEHVISLGPPVIQGEEFITPEYFGFGGWSILSRTGDWHDGWEMGHIAQNEARDLIYPNGIPNYRALKYLNFSHGVEHRNPTQACKGEFVKIISQLEKMGFYPSRARVSIMQPGASTTVHQDAPSNVYMARIHIPIITNEQCIHSCEGIDLHMPADGSAYIMWVNLPHQARNTSNENRYHMLIDVYDTQRITDNFHYKDNYSILETEANRYRAILNNINLTAQEIKIFDEFKQKFVTKD
jgi:Aspartyl/Asparaginyl beta-hydroxylase